MSIGLHRTMSQADMLRAAKTNAELAEQHRHDGIPGSGGGGGGGKLKFAKVTAVFKDTASAAWTGMHVDGVLPVYCAANPCKSDGTGVNTEKTVRVKLNEFLDAPMGYTVAVNDIIGYIGGDKLLFVQPAGEPEPIPLDGFIVHAAGDNGAALIVGRGVMFPVLLDQDGGSGGSHSTQATYTYTLKTLDGLTTLATGKSPEQARPALGEMVSGDGKIGLAYYDHQGTLKLWSANEVEVVEQCS